MSLTSNFDYCVQLSIAAIRAIFHLALKNEELFPHNVRVQRNYSGQQVNITVQLLDDMDAPADLSFADEKHIRFSLPLRLTIQVPDSPDPSLATVSLMATVQAPGLLTTWAVDDDEQLGIDFAGITAVDVEVPSVTGLPVLDAGRFAAALHTKYTALPRHVFTGGGGTLVIYDGTLDPTLTPPNAAGNPEITCSIVPQGTKKWLRVVLPIHASVPAALAFSAYGTMTFHREIIPGDRTVSVNMAVEPPAPLNTVVDFDTTNPAKALVIANLTPLAIGRISDFGMITEPWFTEADAKAALAEEAAAYLADKRFPVYTPQSGDPERPLATPVGFMLPAAGVLAILLNRFDSSVADSAPDAFLGSGDLALAVSRRLLDQTIADAIREQFPGLESGAFEIPTDQGDATLKSLTVTPCDPGEHGEAEGHLWTSGEAEVHIDCWPDPDVTFDGPIFLRLVVTETPTSCEFTVQPEMGEFDAGQSCCDVFVDLIIPIVGWIMLGVIENMIDKVGGELAAEFAEGAAQQVSPIPPVVVGVAELQACLESINVSRQGLLLPGKLRIHRDGTSFEDLAASGNLPRP
jgi:hypothetical protein